MIGSWRSKEPSSNDMVNELKFDIISTRTVEPKNEKKYVAYTVEIGSKEEGGETGSVERRYTDFLTLFVSLRRSHPTLLSGITFPRKVLIGNFTPEHISLRSAAFVDFLNFVSSESQLRTSRPFASFLHDRELWEAIKLILKEQYELARPIVERVFHIVNKVQTARSPQVIRVLCLLLCVSWLSRHPDSPSLAILALRRFQAISDTDLLRYYVPLLQTAREVCLFSGRDASDIADQLSQLQKSGVSLHPGPGLLYLLIEDLTPKEAASV